MRKKYRQKTQILFDILVSLLDGPINISRIEAKSNVTTRDSRKYLVILKNKMYVVRLKKMNNKNYYYEFDITNKGRVLLTDLNVINEKLKWIYNI